MKRILIVCLALCTLLCLNCTENNRVCCSGYPVLDAPDTLVRCAYDLALKTIAGNIDTCGLITAGGEYGGEWTRDISINTFNVCNLLFPEQSVYSLWSVTEDGKTVGHQYWDKIIWVPAAWEQYLVIGDKEMLAKTYSCSALTMKRQEQSVFDEKYGLFNGPSVFNDGIAGYEEPVYDGSIGDACVLGHKNTEHIKCLSTNCIYCIAYQTLAKMAATLSDNAAVQTYLDKAAALRNEIRKNFYDAEAAKLYYLIDQNGDLHKFQEGLGYAFAIMGGIVTPQEASALIRNAYVAPYGVASICPDYKRFSTGKPGRHNNLVWPFVNAYFAEAALIAGEREEFSFELRNLAGLAVDKGEGHFYEIYHPQTGEPHGGWQTGRIWHSCIDQTWSATGYLRMIFAGLFGISFTEEGMIVNPAADLLDAAGVSGISGIRYRSSSVDVCLRRAGLFHKPGLYVNGNKVDSALVPSTSKGVFRIVLYR